MTTTTTTTTLTRLATSELSEVRELAELVHAGRLACGPIAARTLGERLSLVIQDCEELGGTYDRRTYIDARIAYLEAMSRGDVAEAVAMIRVAARGIILPAA